MKDRNLCRKTESNGKKQAQSGSVWEQAEKGRANKEWKKFAVRLSAVGFCVFFLLATGCKRSEKEDPVQHTDQTVLAESGSAAGNATAGSEVSKKTDNEPDLSSKKRIPDNAKEKTEEKSESTPTGEAGNTAGSDQETEEILQADPPIFRKEGEYCLDGILCGSTQEEVLKEFPDVVYQGTQEGVKEELQVYQREVFYQELDRVVEESYFFGKDGLGKGLLRVKVQEGETMQEMLEQLHTFLEPRICLDAGDRKCLSGGFFYLKSNEYYRYDVLKDEKGGILRMDRFDAQKDGDESYAEIRIYKPDPFEWGNTLRGWSEEIVPCYIVKDQTASDIFDLKTEQDWFIREEDGSYLTYQYAWFIDYYNDDVIAEIADKWTYNLEDPDWILNHTADGQTYSLAPNLVIWGFLGDPDLRYGPITYEDFVARELVYPEEQWIIGINSKGQIQHIMEGIHVQ